MRGRWELAVVALLTLLLELGTVVGLVALFALAGDGSR